MPRTLVVGFDGALLDLCDRWMNAGRMPALSSICSDGVSGGLLSVTPYNSAVAWSSLVTGTNPGRHGVFDFVLPLSGSYGYRVATRRDRRTPALWNHVSDAGGRVAVVNIPMTFPAEERLNGVMVSGMDAPGLEERAVHPAEHFAELKRIAPDYRIMSKAALAADHGDFALAERELLDVLRARSSYVCALASKRDFDLVVVNLEATDGSQHFFWQHHDPSHPRHVPAAAKEFGDAIGRVYEATDRELSRLIDAYAPDTVFVVSDHGGAGTNDWVVFTNDWLVDAGLLVQSRRASASAGQRAYGWAKRKMSVPARRALRPMFGKVLEKAKSAALYGDFDWSRSRAYALMQPAVWANMKGREPNGIVHGDELASVAAAVGEAASRLRLPGGERVFTDSIRSDTVYVGDAPHGPDLVLELAAGMHIRSRNATGKAGHLLRLSDLDMYMPSGVHSPRGMFAAAGAGISRVGRLNEDGDIHQVAPSVLLSMGLSAVGMDAEPFSFVSSGNADELVNQVDDRSRPEREPARTPAMEPTPDGLNEAEEEEVLERLRGLGYVD